MDGLQEHRATQIPKQLRMKLCAVFVKLLLIQKGRLTKTNRGVLPGTPGRNLSLNIYGRLYNDIIKMIFYNYGFFYLFGRTYPKTVDMPKNVFFAADMGF